MNVFLNYKKSASNMLRSLLEAENINKQVKEY